MLLIKAIITVSGEPDLYEDKSDEIDDTVEDGLEVAVAYILQKLGKLGVGPVEVKAGYD